MKLIVLRIAKLIGLFKLSSWLTANKLRILGYHGVWFLKNHYGNHLFVSPALFQSRMSWLKRSKYSVISLEDAISAHQNKALPKNSVVITIDDGWYGTYKYMLPVLEQNAFPATLYVYTGAVDTQAPLPNILLPALIQLSKKSALEIPSLHNKSEPLRLDISCLNKKHEASNTTLKTLEKLPSDQVESFCRSVANSLGFDFEYILESRQFSFLSYDEIANADKRGLDIQLHTDTHNLDIKNPEGVTAEIQNNKNKLRPFTTSSLNHFCYPSGVHCNKMQKYLKEEGILSATLINSGLTTSTTNPLELPRILDGQEITQLEFEAEITGFLELARKLKSLTSSTNH